jgi:tetratricopeptide (TPR) repeat protein
MPEHLELLSRGRRGASDRQATLRGAIEWSWSLLEAWEQGALAQCSVFRGGFAAETAEELVDISAHDDAPSVLEVLAALRDKSLLRSHTVPELPGETRLRLYVSVREYAAARLAQTGGTARAALRHAETFTALGERWAAELHGPNGIEARTRLALERDNLLAAATTCQLGDGVRVDTQVGDGEKLATRELGLRLIGPLDALLSTRGPFDRHLVLLDRGVQIAATAPASVRASIFLARARALRHRGRMAESLRDLEDAIGIAEGGDLSFLARLELERAEVHQAQGRIDEARSALSRARDLLPRSDDGATRGRIERSLGLLYHSQGRLDDAWESYARAQTLFRQKGDVTAEATVLHYFGSLRLQQGRLDEARAHYERALELERQIGDTRVVGSILGNLGILEQELGRLGPARARFGEALECIREVGDRTLEGHLLGYLAGLALEEGELDEAHARYEDAITLLRDIGDKRLEGLFLAVRGALDARLGREASATEAFEASSALLEELGDPGLLGALALHRAHLPLVRHRALCEADPSGAEDAWREAHADLRESEETRSELRTASDDFRFAQRVLRRALAEGALVIPPDAAWLELPDGVRVDLSARQPLRRIVARLAEHRLSAPGEPVSVDELVAAGWPDERMLPSAAGNRIGVALTSLRKLGLRELLRREGEGYALDPAVPLIRP